MAEGVETGAQRDVLKGLGCELAQGYLYSKPVPVDLTVTFDNGDEEKIHRSIAVWKDGAQSVTVPVHNGRTIKKVTLGSLYVPDSYPGDNVWVAPE